MLNGLKVIKVFSHEPESKTGFDKYNEELRQASGKANTYAAILFPIMGNMGNLLYVLIAFVGGAVAINGWAPLSLVLLVHSCNYQSSLVCQLPRFHNSWTQWLW